jgi:predicted ATPase
VRDALARARLVTVTGPGGIGKSSLARDLSRGALREAAIVTCDLDGAGDLESVIGSIAGACSIRRSPSARGVEALSVIARKLSARSGAWVLLDNVDAVVGPVAAFVRACLDAGAGARFLVTSREPLVIEGEQVVPLGPLAHEDAVAMFEARASGGRWQRAELDALVDQLDGIPLCIELAARRSGLVPPGALILRLDERFRLLKSDRRDIAARHMTLAATMEWSWERLSADEQKALACLGLFEGQVIVEAFESVVAPLLEGDPLDAAQALLRKSWITSVDAHGAARLTMLRTLRAFARERLAELDGREEAEARQAQFYVAHVHDAASRAYGPTESARSTPSKPRCRTCSPSSSGSAGARRPSPRVSRSRSRTSCSSVTCSTCVRRSLPTRAAPPTRRATRTSGPARASSKPK